MKEHTALARVQLVCAQLLGPRRKADDRVQIEAIRTAREVRERAGRVGALGEPLGSEQRQALRVVGDVAVHYGEARRLPPARAKAQRAGQGRARLGR